MCTGFLMTLRICEQENLKHDYTHVTSYEAEIAAVFRKTVVATGGLTWTTPAQKGQRYVKAEHTN